VTRTRRRRLLLFFVVAVIVVITMRPWSTFVGHSHWDLVEWVPFINGIYPFDIVANILLFTPFGLVCGWSRRRRPVVRSVLAGALLSMAIELYQVYCHGHFPAMTDVLMNSGGAWLGARLAWRYSPRPARVADVPQSAQDAAPLKGVPYGTR
jgi:glycopeptide antibiotics resistance protein